MVYDLRNVPGTFAQIIEVRIISKKAECVRHADCMAQFTLCEGTTKFIDVLIAATASEKRLSKGTFVL